jgi:NAD(P)-dependent dehydrogenase (short-subunit alcohol dehydrogenase family)
MPSQELFSLKDKTAFITGAAGGIGMAVAQRFISAGARVVIADIIDGTQVADEMGAIYIPVDTGKEDSVAAALQSAVAKLDAKLDIVCNNAGVGDIGPTIEETEQALIEKTTRINQWGVMYGLKHAPKYMNDSGSIINTASMAAFENKIGTAVYSATKRAILSMTEMSALELGHRGIRVNAVCPGYTATTMGSGVEGVKLTEAFTAIGRVATVEDLIGVYHFLAADESSYITGQAIKVDGGWSCGPSAQLLEQIIGRDHLS